jgi:hypothetical protein
MAVEKQKMAEVFSRLPEELQDEVLAFAESLLKRNPADKSDDGGPTVSSFFGVWDSGNPHSADSDTIDRDLAHEYANPHDSK